MRLYFTPMACSLACRMALCQAGLDQETEFQSVVLKDKTLNDGADFRKVSPKGQVPALITREGQLLTENSAILQYIADLAPDSGLAPPAGTFGRVRLQEWLSFLSTELHKSIFHTLFHPLAPEESRTFAREVLAPPRLEMVDRHLAENDFLLNDGHFSVADAYLATILNWLKPAGLAMLPHLQTYQNRVLQLEAVARAQREEFALWSAA